MHISVRKRYFHIVFSYTLCSETLFLADYILRPPQSSFSLLIHPLILLLQLRFGFFSEWGIIVAVSNEVEEEKE